MQHVDGKGDDNRGPARSRSVYIATFGCQMNVRDSEIVAGILKKKRFSFVDDAKKADCVLINTCAVRQHAEDRVWSEIGACAKLKNKPLIGLIGCMAQNYKENSFQRAKALDFVVGPADIAKIPSIIKDLLKTRGQSLKNGDSPHKILERKIWETDGLNRPEEVYHTGYYEPGKDHAFVVISEGCTNFCSYCVVPYTRGALRHRNHQDIIKEIKSAIKKGIAKFTLLGQNVSAYHSDKVNFVELVRLVNSVKGVKEFTFMTSHPKDTNVELFKAIRDNDKLAKFLHLPVQSGSDSILKLMNRGYTRKFYLDLIDNYRKIVPEGILTTDIIVGFPGETDKDFQDTFDLVKEVRFNGSFIFKYSPRPKTEALKYEDDISKELKEKRHKAILDLQIKICKEKKAHKNEIKN